MMRWQTLDAVGAVTLATLLSRGADPVALKVESNAKVITASAAGQGWRQVIQLTTDLRPLDGKGS
jgi:hypothetical protein